MQVYHVNVPQYDDASIITKYLKLLMLEVTEFRSDFPSVRQK